MSLSVLTLVSSILSLLYNVLRLSKDFILSLKIFKRNRKIKDKYKESEKAVEKGDIDKINDIIRNR